MTVSPDRNRAHREHHPGRLALGPRGRFVGLLAGVAGVVLVAAGLAVVLGGGITGTGSGQASIAPSSGGAIGGQVSSSPAGASGSSASPGGSSASTAAPASSAAAAAGEVRATRITISRLGIDLPIIEGDGVDVPLGKAAHYPGTAWPGGGSNIYLYAHARDGMFIALWQARAGDVVALQLADQTTRRYVVTRVLPDVPWNAIQYLDPTPTEQLTLQTCTSYGPTAPRFIVIAVPAT